MNLYKQKQTLVKKADFGRKGNNWIKPLKDLILYAYHAISEASEQQNASKFSKCLNWSGRRDSNSESLGPKPSAIAVTLRPANTHLVYRDSPNPSNGLLSALILKPLPGEKI